jgi:ABC-2 type transport system permease protein
MALSGSDVKLDRSVSLSALATLFWLTVRQHRRGRRIWILGFLFLLPAGIAAISLHLNPETGRSTLQYGLIFSLIPRALLPLTAVWYAAGMIHDEVEEQTLTYLLVRPLPRWLMYSCKLLATALVAILLAAAGTMLTFAVIYWTDAAFWEAEGILRALETVALSSLTMLCYCSIFAFISISFRRSLLLGAAYILVFEWIIADIPFVVRSITVMYYFRVLAERWLGVRYEDWAIQLDQAPAAITCLMVLVGTTLLALFLGAVQFSNHEFRVKTPEGS